MTRLISITLLLLGPVVVYAQGQTATPPASTTPTPATAASPAPPATTSTSTPSASTPTSSAGSEQPDRFEFSAAYFGAFPSAADGNNVHQGATSSWGVLGDARWFFTEHHGIELDYGYTRDTQQYLRFDAANAVHTDVHEATASYVWHFTSGIMTPFLSAGGGALVYVPMGLGTITPNPATLQARAAFVYAAGLDLAVSPRLSIRQEYRAFVLRAPTFNTGVGSEGGQYISEAILGFNWKL